MAHINLLCRGKKTRYISEIIYKCLICPALMSAYLRSKVVLLIDYGGIAFSIHVLTRKSPSSVMSISHRRGASSMMADGKCCSRKMAVWVEPPLVAIRRKVGSIPQDATNCDVAITRSLPSEVREFLSVSHSALAMKYIDLPLLSWWQNMSWILIHAHTVMKVFSGTQALPHHQGQFGLQTFVHCQLKWHTGQWYGLLYHMVYIGWL